VHPVRLLDNRLYDGIDDFAAVQDNADVVADFVEFGRHRTSLAEQSLWARAGQVDEFGAYANLPMHQNGHLI
jgi:hypothetical protein